MQKHEEIQSDYLGLVHFRKRSLNITEGCVRMGPLPSSWAVKKTSQSKIEEMQMLLCALTGDNVTRTDQLTD